MLLVNEETIHALRVRLQATRDVQGCRVELEKALQIIEGLLWRAEGGRACVGPWIPTNFAYEVQMLEQALGALDEGSLDETISILEEYESFVHWRNGTVGR